MKKLAWSKWELALSRTPPPKIPGAVFKLSERYNVFLRKNLFDNDLNYQCVFEIGVTLPGAKKRRIYPMYFRTSLGFNVCKGMEPICLVNNSGVRKEVRDCQINTSWNSQKEKVG